MSAPSYINFDGKYQQKLREYTLVGEVGVLSYKWSAMVLPLWRFRTPEIAEQSATAILRLMSTQIAPAPPAVMRFIRADICRKFLQMGYTRSRRYDTHASGRKWIRVACEWIIAPEQPDSQKEKSAKILNWRCKLQ